MTPQRKLHDLEAEAAVIGAGLWRADVVAALASLEPGHFSDPVNAAFWGEMRRRASAGEIIEAFSIRKWALAQPFANAINVSNLILAYQARAAHLQDHALEQGAIVREYAGLRHAQGLAAELSALVMGDAAVSDIAARLRTAADALALSAGGDLGVLLRDAWASVEAGLTRPLSPSARFGLAGLDRRLGGLFAPDLVILAGRPAMGKTSLATNIAVNAALSGGVVHFASMEMSEEQIAGRVGSRLIGSFNYSDLRQPQYRPSPESVAGKAGLFPTSMVIDATGQQSLAHLETQARSTKRRFGGKLSLIVVDYLQLMAASQRRGQGRVQEVTEITAGLKAISKNLHVPVLALSQLSRQVESRDDKRPMMSDLRESGSIEQDADSILFAYRDEYYLRQNQPKPQQGEARAEFDIREERWQRALDAAAGRMDIIIGKNRHGACDVIQVRFDPPKDTISDMDTPA